MSCLTVGEISDCRAVTLALLCRTRRRRLLVQLKLLKTDMSLMTTIDWSFSPFQKI